MAVNYISIGERIRIVRKRRGLSQNVLAEKIKRSPGYVSYVEGGVRGMSPKHPPVASLLFPEQAQRSFYLVCGTYTRW